MEKENKQKLHLCRRYIREIISPNKTYETFLGYYEGHALSHCPAVWGPLVSFAVHSFFKVTYGSSHRLSFSIKCCFSFGPRDMYFAFSSHI